MLTAQDHAIRSTGVGSSEIAMLVYLEDQSGNLKPLSPWGGAHKLWRRKTGREPERKAAAHMDRGNYMESGLLDWYAAENGWQWERRPTMAHPTTPYVVDSVDAVVSRVVDSGPARCVEAKAITGWAPEGWGAAGTDEIPAYYITQCQWHLACHQPSEMICDVPVDDGARRKDYHVSFDEDLFGHLAELANRFWVDHVVADVEPKIDSARDATQWLSRYTSHSDGLGLLEADESSLAMMLNYRYHREEETKSGRVAECIKERLMRVIGEYDGIVTEDRTAKISWRRSKDSRRIGWKGVAECLFDQMLEDGAISPKSYEEIKKENISIVSGSRRWLDADLLENAPKQVEAHEDLR